MNEQKPKPATVPISVAKSPEAVTPQPESDPKSTRKSHKSKKAQKATNPESTAKPEHKTAKMVCYIIILLIFFGLVCATTIIVLLTLREPEDNNPTVDRVEFPDPIYSTLTGEEISDAALNNSPTFCVQIPNGQDGARPQAGLNQAAVVFEAIAEAGITRFAAVFQNVSLSAIGPIRSLRPYYLEWDLPFDCTVVHAGGSDEAMAELRQTGARELNEDYEYMWRENGNDRMWNNLFTSSTDLIRYNNDRGWTSSNPKSFSRNTPEENDQILAQNFSCAESTTIIEGAENSESIEDVTCDTAPISNIRINFSGVPSYNTVYQYDAENNRYLRSYANGEEHLSYTCPDNLNQPRTTTDCGAPSQVAPKVVVAMFVQESKMSDNYHENITTISSGSATIFQNGTVIEGTWQKTSANSQIVFRDNAGNLIKFAPGQVWIAAVPVFGGSIAWD